MPTFLAAPHVRPPARRLQDTEGASLCRGDIDTERFPPEVLTIRGRSEVVGYAAVHPEDCEMFLLFVHPAHAGRGIGRRLLAAADDALRSAGCREAFLFVNEKNERAIAVYQAAGYHPDGSDRVSDFRGTRLRELRLVQR